MYTETKMIGHHGNDPLFIDQIVRSLLSLLQMVAYLNI